MKSGSTVERWAANRRSYLDNLKVALIAAIIAGGLDRRDADATAADDDDGRHGIVG